MLRDAPIPSTGSGQALTFPLRGKGPDVPANHHFEVSDHWGVEGGDRLYSIPKEIGA